MISLKETGLFQDRQIQVLQRRGLRDVRDLLYYFPRRYVDRSKILDLKTVKLGEIVTFIGTIKKNDIAYGSKRRLIVKTDYQGFTIDLVFFQGINYFQKMLMPGTEAVFSGALETFGSRFSILHPEIEIFSGGDLIHTGKIVPFYKTTDSMRSAGLSARALREAVSTALKKYGAKIQDHLPEYFIKDQEYLPLKQAIENMHFPETQQSIEKARERLAFDELLFFSALIREKKEKRLSLKKPNRITVPIEKKAYHKEIITHLPFKLTADQEKAIGQIQESSMRESPFHFLLTGDVGSGKTMVALLSAIMYAEEGMQTALMAPTEILARQHYRTFLNYLSVLPFVQVELLLGAEKASERKARLDRIKRGDSLIIIGTHSLIQEDVTFNKLSLVVIDEQHRFGVEQREKLRAKGNIPDFLAMTATPIPRSLSLALFGDLDTLSLREKPAGRLPIDTRLFTESTLPGIYRSIRKYVNEGRQVYIVYPLIEQTENNDWASLVADYKMLESTVFPDLRLGLLHGKLSSEEKDRAMQKFSEGLIQILVCTTVIEVGVDVPNANVMVIRNAERFGLSQLHQLRGRVGRGQHSSFCILVTPDEISDDGKQRLNAMRHSEDGFFLASKDFEIRGAGELLGLRQAGVSEFRIADLRHDAPKAEKAAELLERDKSLLSSLRSVKDWQKQLQKGLILFAN